MNNPKALHEQIAEKLIAELEAGTSPFQKPWTDEHSAGFMTPENPTTGKAYRGMNALWLAMQNRQDPRWMTLKQASFNNWQVEKGAKATLINFVKTSDLRFVLDGNNEKQLDEHGKPLMEEVKLDKPVITTAFVFNGEQIKGIPDWKEAYDVKVAERTWMPIERAEQLLKASKADISHGGNEAYYSPRYDFIRLPEQGQFAAPAQYYATALHELGHWTGHSSRLDRPLSGKFGSEEYAKEELRAEIASLMLGSELNIGHNFGHHAAYVESWIKVLHDDPFELFKASADAQRIVDHVLKFEQKREITQDTGQGQDQASLPKDGKNLDKGDVIDYNETRYEVLAILRGKTAQLEDMADGRKFKVGPKDALYASLVAARNDPAAAAIAQAQKTGQAPEQTRPVHMPRGTNAQPEMAGAVHEPEYQAGR